MVEPPPLAEDGVQVRHRLRVREHVACAPTAHRALDGQPDRELQKRRRRAHERAGSRAARGPSGSPGCLGAWRCPRPRASSSPPCLRSAAGERAAERSRVAPTPSRHMWRCAQEGEPFNVSMSIPSLAMRSCSGLSTSLTRSQPVRSTAATTQPHQLPSAIADGAGDEEKARGGTHRGTSRRRSSRW